MIDTSSTLSKLLSASTYTEKTGTVYSSVEEAQKANGALDRDAFLQLLVTQLSYQDPTDPMSNQDFSAQLAQYSSLEEMQELNESMQTQSQLLTMSSGASLIGKQVSGYSNLSAENVSGVVESIVVVDGETYLKVGAKYLKISEVYQIQTPTTETE